MCAFFPKVTFSLHFFFPKCNIEKIRFRSSFESDDDVVTRVTAVVVIGAAATPRVRFFFSFLSLSLFQRSENQTPAERENENFPRRREEKCKNETLSLFFRDKDKVVAHALIRILILR